MLNYFDARCFERNFRNSEYDFYNFSGMYFVAFLGTNVAEDIFSIFFNFLTVEYSVFVLRHEYYVVSDLTIAITKTT